MTDRQITESTIGLAGRLSHLPYRPGEAEDRGWHSTRNFSQHTPVFAELGPHETWLSASGTTGIPSPGISASTPWHSSRRQQKWLLRAHPEAHLGNEYIHDQLVLSHQSPTSHGQPWASFLFSIGELTDTSKLQRVSGAPLVAIADGDANDTLRLVKPSVSEWQWHNDDSVSLLLANVKEDDESIHVEEETAGPIRQLKTVVDPKRYDPTRWVIVQRDSGTRVFRPEYQKTATISKHNAGGNPSRIAANPIFFLSKDRTGGSSHADASFNTGERSKPPQLGLIDERGFWSVWNIAHTKIKSRKQTVHLSKCGHIEKGVLDHLPSKYSGETEWHKLLWVGCLEGGLDESPSFDYEDDADMPEIQGSFPQLVRSNMLLLGNPKLVRLLDLISNSFLPDIPFVREGSRDCILDIQENLQDTQYFYVLTTAKLFVVRVYSTPGQVWGDAQKQWTIVLSVSHLRNGLGQNLRLATAPGPQSTGPASCLVYLYSHDSARIDLFFITMQKRDPFRITYHSEVVMLDALQHSSPSAAVRAMCVHPVPVAMKRSSNPAQSTRELAKQQIRFYQLAVLRTDMCIMSTLCASACAFPVDQISRPDRQVGRAKRPPRGQNAVSKDVSSFFVVRDDAAMWANGGARDQATVAEAAPLSRRPVTQRWMKLFHEHLGTILGDQTESHIGPSSEKDTSAPLNRIHDVVEYALENVNVALATLFQMLENPTLPRNVSLADAEWTPEVERIGRNDPTISLLRFDRPQSQVTRWAASLQELHTALIDMVETTSSGNETQDWTREARGMASRQIACDIYLSLVGVVRRQMDLSESPRTLTYDLENMVIDSQEESVTGGSSRAGSEALTSALQTEQPDGEDAAMTLLRSYTGTGKFVPAKRTALADKWEVGVNPKDYVFDLDRDKEETAGMQKRVKQLARQDRKRRRAETLLNISQRDGEPTLPASQPAPETRFFSSQISQPVIRSSQTQAIPSDPLQPMSQPIRGTFGRRDDRQKKKVKKRKMGF
ncbi:hypothetical protein GGR52DRAFT_523747 [Hypoxylon sp. FL1284]|nr:hypothetical protein GGR52DRAFT_523747 [Hypoxylon sp. FL1284]